MTVIKTPVKAASNIRLVCGVKVTLMAASVSNILTIPFCLTKKFAHLKTPDGKLAGVSTAR